VLTRRPTRRHASPDECSAPEYKLAIVTKYENAPNGGKSAILRRT
jgi:hypothetical protein